MNAKRRSCGVCLVCRQPIGKAIYGECDRCKARNRIAKAAKRGFQVECQEPVDGQEERIERYADLVAAGKRIFE